MSMPIKYSLFCHRYELNESDADSQNLYNIYIKHTDTFNLIMTELIVNRAMKKARNNG